MKEVSMLENKKSLTYLREDVVSNKILVMKEGIAEFLSWGNKKQHWIADLVSRKFPANVEYYHISYEGSLYVKYPNFSKYLELPNRILLEY